MKPTKLQNLIASMKPCQRCGKLGTSVRLRRQSTSYVDDEQNFNIMCEPCFEQTEEDWELMWEQYYGGAL